MKVNEMFYRRFLEPRICEALEDTPVVLIAGPRQAGKTTLVKGLGCDDFRYLSLDDANMRASALHDPTGFIRDLDRAIIDEIQRAPDLLLAIKKSVDEDRRPGRFLLTGSANIMTVPTVADSLAGRMEMFSLFPLSRSEMQGCDVNWIDKVFAGHVPTVSRGVIGKDLVEAVLAGGYPEVVARTSARRRSAWVRQYLNALIQRDVRDIASIEKVGSLPRFLKALATLSGQLCNYTKVGGQVGLDQKTVIKYMAVFEQMFLLLRIEAWAANRLKRVVKTPKLHFLDAAVLAQLIGITPENYFQNRATFGNILESFIYGELLKQISFSEEVYRIYHYRDRDQVEVDFVVENELGQIAAIEIKAGATVSRSDFRGLLRLKDSCSDCLVAGFILYDGEETLPFGDGLYAVPLSSLWCA